MTVLSVLYGLQSLAVAVSYAPQMRSVWKSRTGAQDISIATWLIGSATSLVSLVHAPAVVKDLPFIVVSATSLVGSLAVSAIAGVRRIQHLRKHERPLLRTRYG